MDDDEQNEYEDPPEEREKKIEKAVTLLTTTINDPNGYLVIYTGAGISTPVKIRSFRGKNGLHNCGGFASIREEVLDVTMPSLSHYVIAKLVLTGKVKFVVTSNHDGLHVKAGVPTEQIVEIFGCAYIEQCLKCSKRYRRSVVVPGIGRYCDDGSCSGRLKKTGIRYGQMIPKLDYDRAWEQACKSTVALVLGSSGILHRLEMPQQADHIITCCMQQFQHDHLGLAIYAKCDELMLQVAKALGISFGTFEHRIPFQLKYEFVEEENGGQCKLVLEGMNVQEPCPCIEDAVAIANSNTNSVKVTLQEQQNKSFSGLISMPWKPPNGEYKVQVNIQYKEIFGGEEMAVEVTVGPTQKAKGTLDLAITFQVQY